MAASGTDHAAVHARRLIAAVAVLAATPAAASVVRALNVEDLARRADVVVLGQIVGQEPKRSGDRKRIFTYVHVRVDETWLGETGPTLLLAVPGGELEGVGQQIAGAPHVALAERVVLFLRRHGATFSVVGLAQGVFHVSGGQAVPTVAQDLSGLALAQRNPSGQLAIGAAGQGGEAPQTLSDLRSRVLAVRR